ncbi:alpha/beta hydrolase [Novosphingobium sp. ST904]|uniref:alpha/beta hydrolase n=1 Tax=Novosphingobium sp. ST904 TaxID=1684385 RepID=UPI0006C8778F|nr:alpha/beta hydrolase-fold protein [Novosphingobium sp. ST904]
MKIIATSLVIPGLFAAGLVLAPQIASAKDAAPREISGQPIELGTRYELRSAVLGDTREVNVWLPTGYDKSADRYPVVYLLDGGLDQDFVHIAGLGSLASLSWTYGPMIVVGVQTKDRRAELTSRPTDPRYLSAFPESGGADRFRRFLRDEVIPFVEARFRSGDRRALMGESLAGLFVVDTLLNDPTLFGDYVAVSPSLWWDDRVRCAISIGPRQGRVCPASAFTLRWGTRAERCRTVSTACAPISASSRPRGSRCAMPISARARLTPRSITMLPRKRFAGSIRRRPMSRGRRRGS